MDEYIKREDVIKHLRGACIAKYPLSFSYGIFASADEISKLPPADVVPKIEVEKWKQINEQLHKEMSERMMEERKIERKLVAREIFAEIDKIFRKQYELRSQEDSKLFLPAMEGERFAINETWNYVAELKEKYQEGE